MTYPEDSQINYSIGEVEKMVELPSHTLRYWEKEFDDFLSPSRSLGKQRRYAGGDLETIRLIKKLLKEEKFSIAGARQQLQRQMNKSSDESIIYNQKFIERVAEILKTKLIEGVVP